MDIGVLADDLNKSLPGANALAFLLTGQSV